MGNVGLFNLLWLAMGRTTPPADLLAYRTAQVGWTFAQAVLSEREPVFHGQSIVAHAAMKALPEFAQYVLAHRALTVTPFGAHDVYALKFRELLMSAAR